MNITQMARTTDPRELRVIVALIKEGYTPQEVCRTLKISLATYYRRMAEVRELEARAREESDYG